MKPRTRSDPWRPYLFVFRKSILHSPPHFSKWAVSRQSSPPVSQLRKLGSRALRGFQVTGARHSPNPPPPVPWSGAAPPLVRSPKAAQLTDRPHGSSGNPSSSQFPSNTPRRRGKAMSGSSRCRTERAICVEEHPDPTQLPRDAGCGDSLLVQCFLQSRLSLHLLLRPTSAYLSAGAQR